MLYNLYIFEINYEIAVGSKSYGKYFINRQASYTS